MNSLHGAVAKPYEFDREALRIAIETAAEDPIWFRREVLGVTDDLQDEWQDELLEAVLDIFRKRNGQPTKYNHQGLNRISIRSGHGVGKTTGCAEVMHLIGFISRCQIICTATKYKQVTTRLWPRFRMLRATAIDEYQYLMDVSAEKIVWADDPDWYAEPETAAQGENLQGFHPNAPGDVAVVIVDEASGLKQVIFEVLQGALSSGDVILILIGNPTQNQGEFFESHTKPAVASMYYRMHITPERSKHVSKRWVEQMAQRYRVDSPVYKVRVAGEFAETAEFQLISHTWIMAAHDREPVNDGSLPRLRIAVDVADGGVDESVFKAARLFDTHTVFLKQLRRSFPSSESPVLCADEAERLFVALGGRKDEDDFVVDSIGVGAGTAGILMSRGYRVVCYKGGESSDDATQWRNRRTQSYLCLRNAFRDGTVSYAEGYASEQDIDDEIDQLCAIRTKPGTEKLEDLETKKELVDRTNKSPDLADSDAMIFATQMPNQPSTMLMGSVIAIGSMESSHANQ